MTLRMRLADLTIQRWSLGDRWDALHPPKRTRDDWGLTFPSELYCQIFDRTFPKLARNPWKVSAKGSYATFFRRLSEDDLIAVRGFIEVLRPCVVIKDLTDGSIALGFRARKSGTREPERTELGQLMRDAKPYDQPPAAGHRKAGTDLAHRLCSFFSSMPCYGNVDGFVAVPSSGPAKPFSLPRGFATALAKHTGKPDLSSALTKPKATPQLKNLPRPAKVAALLGSVTVDRKKVAGQTIVVVDDLYQSGFTLNYIAEELRAAGAKTVFGLAAIKTLRDDDNVPRIAGGPAAIPTNGDGVDDEDLYRAEL